MQEDNLRRKVASMRRPEDPFLYEPVFVPSLTDALIGVMFNHNVQVVVVRNGLRLESEQTLDILHRYRSRLDEDALADVEPKEYGPELCRLIAKLRPELDVHLFHRPVGGGDCGGRSRQLPSRLLQPGRPPGPAPTSCAASPTASRPLLQRLTQYARKPTGCSTQCRSVAASRSPARTGSRTWASSTA